MESVDQFLKAWKNSKDIEDFLEQRFDLPNPDMIRAHLETLPSDQQAKMFEELTDILTRLDVHAESMEDKLKDIKEQMEKTKSSETMCMSYEKAKDTKKT